MSWDLPACLHSVYMLPTSAYIINHVPPQKPGKWSSLIHFDTKHAFLGRIWGVMPKTTILRKMGRNPLFRGDRICHLREIALLYIK